MIYDRKPKRCISRFDQLLIEAIDKFRNDELEEAYKYIMNACEADPNAPQPHNLLGIWYELKARTI